MSCRKIKICLCRFRSSDERSSKRILAKLYMVKHDFAKAAEQCEAIITSGEYTLLPRYVDNFLPAGENGTESVLKSQLLQNRRIGSDRHLLIWFKEFGEYKLGFSSIVQVMILLPLMNLVIHDAGYDFIYR